MPLVRYRLCCLYPQRGTRCHPSVEDSSCSLLLFEKKKTRADISHKSSTQRYIHTLTAHNSADEPNPLNPKQRWIQSCLPLVQSICAAFPGNISTAQWVWNGYVTSPLPFPFSLPPPFFLPSRRKTSSPIPQRPRLQHRLLGVLRPSSSKTAHLGDLPKQHPRPHGRYPEPYTRGRGSD